MFITPYLTTVCKDYVLDKIVNEIQKTVVLDGAQLHRLEENVFGGEPPRNIDVFLVGPEATNVPPFAHPLITKLRDSDEAESVVLDVRNFTRVDRQGEMVISSVLDYNLAVSRGLLSGYWQKEHPDDLLGLGNVQVTIFARWLTELLTQHLALTPETQMRVTVISAFFYLCMFREEVELTDKEKTKMAAKISQSTKIGQDVVQEILGRLEQLLNVHDYVAALISVGDSARLENFNLGLLYTLVGGSWFGSNAKEILAVALEHPPTFIALIAAAMKERGYRKTRLGKVVEFNARRGDDKSFLYNLHRLPL